MSTNILHLYLCFSRPNDDPQCHCNDGFGGLDCSQSDVNECKYRPCAIHAECTNTLGSFTCACREGKKESSGWQSVLKKSNGAKLSILAALIVSCM